MEILEILNNLNLENNIKLDEIPEIDLYMDQVIQLFESKLSEQKRNEDEKILTKTMINNYAKGKLLLPIKNKKYSKEHIILMSLIYNLKGALSINDIKASLEEIKDNPEEERHSLRDLYTCFLENCINDESNFKEDVINKIKKIDDKIEKNKLLNDILFNLENFQWKFLSNYLFCL